MKVALIPGHTPSSPGATTKRNGRIVSEFSYNLELVKFLNSLLAESELVHPFVMFRQSDHYETAMKEFIPLVQSMDLCLEFHLNAWEQPVANGREVLLHYRTSDGNIRAAKRINQAIALSIGSRDRGIKFKKDGERGFGFLNLPGTRCQIVEPGFISNPEELEILYQERGSYAKELAAALEKIAEEWSDELDS